MNNGIIDVLYGLELFLGTIFVASRAFGWENSDFVADTFAAYTLIAIISIVTVYMIQVMFGNNNQENGE